MKVPEDTEPGQYGSSEANPGSGKPADDAGDPGKRLVKNVIRRREETNATRSLLNTAKVMETNAVALRLKELETLEKITDKIGNISVYGGLDSVLNDLVRMKQ